MLLAILKPHLQVLVINILTLYRKFLQAGAGSRQPSNGLY
jgi:hypothetical protein